MSHKINALFIVLFLLGIFVDGIRAKEEMLLFMENEIHRCNEKLDASDKMLLKYENACYKEINKCKDLGIIKDKICDNKLQIIKLEIDSCKDKCDKIILVCDKV
ncbi:hypothetical protein C2G38_2128572, partial [Gigaspora rosea]